MSWRISLVAVAIVIGCGLFLNRDSEVASEVLFWGALGVGPLSALWLLASKGKNPRRSASSRAVKTRRIGVYCFVAALILVSLYACHLATKLYLARTNTLYRNGHWDSTKTLLECGVLGAASFMVTRVSLQGNSVHLGAWYGFQELWYNRPLEAERVKFDFQLEPDAWLAFLFNKTQTGGFSAALISRSETRASAYLDVSPTGEFMSEQTFDLDVADGWHCCEAVFDEGRGGIVLSIDGQRIGRFKEQLAKMQRIGFRGSKLPAKVDNIQIDLRNSPQPIREEFDSQSRYWGVWPSVVGIMLLVNSLFYALAMRRQGIQFGLFLVATANAQIFLTLILLWFVDDRVLSKTYTAEPPWGMDLYGRNIAGSGDVLLSIREKYGPKEEGVYRILFIGTSQTWGAGARTNDETFVRILESKLNQESGDEITYECVNTGVSGFVSGPLLNRYAIEWSKLEPDLLVINLGTNDEFVEEFVSNMNSFCAISSANGTRIIFVQEPNCNENDPADKRFLRKKHRRMEEVGLINRAPVVRMHDYLLQNANRGFLWWDHVHLTSFGHRLFAEYLHEQLNAHRILPHEPIEAGM